MQQRARLKALDRFKAMPTALLLATDVAARGLDISGVDAVRTSPWAPGVSARTSPWAPGVSARTSPWAPGVSEPAVCSRGRASLALMPRAA